MKGIEYYIYDIFRNGSNKSSRQLARLQAVFMSTDWSLIGRSSCRGILWMVDSPSNILPRKTKCDGNVIARTSQT